ncbi:MAG: PA14 domain-containing protein [Planctomycetota bacterium]
MKECVMDAIRRCVTSWRAAGLVLLASGFMASSACAQPDGAMMPEGWRDFEAAQFLPAAKTLYGSTPRPVLPHAKEVAVHAWERFLLVETFVTSEEWPVVQGMADLFVPRRNLLLESGWSASRVEAAVSGLRDRIQAYLAGNDGLVTQASFEELLTLSSVLDEAGQSDEQRGSAFSRWMDANSWRGLTLAQQSQLFEGLRADVMDFRSMSVRWTGQITSPDTSTRSFRILRPYRSRTNYRLWISGQLILDSREQVGAPRQYYESQAVAFTRGQSVSIKVELDNRYRGPNKNGEGSPAMVLQWVDSEARSEVVPTEALTPAGQAGAETGLKGDYFGTPNFEGAALATRVDSSLQSIWTWEPIVARFPNHWEDLMQEFLQKFNNDAYLGQLEENDRDQLMKVVVGTFTARLSLTDRTRLIERIEGLPQLLTAISPQSMASLIQSTYLLPSGGALRLLAAWSNAVSPPRCELGVLTRRKDDLAPIEHFSSVNVEPYATIGGYFQGPYWSGLNTLIDEQLAMADGRCNLHLAYIASSAAQGNPDGQAVRDRIDEALADDSISGDMRMTWLLAKAFDISLVGNERVRPVRAIGALEEAMLRAQTTSNRFWALQELVARLGSLGQGDDALALLDRHSGNFTSDQQVADIAAWRAQISELQNYYRDVRETTAAEQASAALAKHVEQLRARLDAARAAGNTSDVNRYEALLSALIN